MLSANITLVGLNTSLSGVLIRRPDDARRGRVDRGLTQPALPADSDPVYPAVTVANVSPTDMPHACDADRADAYGPRYQTHAGAHHAGGGISYVGAMDEGAGGALYSQQVP